VYLAARVLLDLAHASGVGGLATVASAVVLLGMLGLVVLALRDRVYHPAVYAIAPLVAVLTQAGSPDLASGRWLALFLGPAVVLLATAAWTGPLDGWRWSHWVAGAALIPLVWDGWAWLTGQPASFVLNDYPRLLGGYANPHTHAVALAVFVSIGLLWAEAGRGRERWLGAGLAAVALLFLGLTWVRTAMLMVVVQGVVYLWLQGRRRWLLSGAVLVLVLVLAIPGLRDRFFDIGLLLSGTPPEGGWGAIGSWRFRIWAESFAAFAEHGPMAWLFGLGLGAQHTLHKHLDPHSEVLALLYQAGVLAPFCWYAMIVIAGWAARPTGVGGRADAFRAHAVGWAAAVGFCAPISNDVLTRVTLTWWVFAALGAASGKREPGAHSSGERDREVVVDAS
jgi:hypothetical protein